MKLIVGLLMTVILAGAVAVIPLQAQGVKRGPATIRDPDLEKDSLHNLEVARNYFKLKKAYVAALRRCEEIVAGNPNFEKLDEVLYIAGQSSLALAENKGKQSPNLYVSFEGVTKHTLTSEQFRVMGREYLTQLVTDYPNSNFAKQAADDLRAVGGPIVKETTKQ